MAACAALLAAPPRSASSRGRAPRLSRPASCTLILVPVASLVLLGSAAWPAARPLLAHVPGRNGIRPFPNLPSRCVQGPVSSSLVVPRRAASVATLAMAPPLLPSGDFGESARTPRHAEKKRESEASSSPSSSSSSLLSASLESVEGGVQSEPEELWESDGRIRVARSKTELEEVVHQDDNKLYVVEFAQHHCRPCRYFQRKFEKLADEFQGTAQFLKVYGETNESTKKMFKTYKIAGTPSFLIFHKGALAGRTWGINPAKIVRAIESIVEKSEQAGGAEKDAISAKATKAADALMIATS